MEPFFSVRCPSASTVTAYSKSQTTIGYFCYHKPIAVISDEKQENYENSAK